MGPSPRFVAAVLGACMAVAGGRLLLPRAAHEVELVAAEVVNVRGGQAVLVLREKGGDRRMAVPITRQQASTLDALRRGRPRAALVGRALAAVGAHVARVRLDDTTSAQIEIASGAQRVIAEAPVAEALGVA